VSNLRVLLVHNFYRSDLIGGEDVVFRAEVSALKERLGDSSVYVYTKSNDEINKFALVSSLFFSVSNFINVYALVRSRRISVVHVHNFFPIISPSVFLAAKLAGAKLVLTLHNYRWWCIAGTFFEDTTGICEHCRSKVFSFRAITKKCYRGSIVESFVASVAFAFYRITQMLRIVDVVFVLTDFQRRKIIELGLPAHKIKLKPNFVQSAKPNVRVVRENKFIFVGRLEKSKGILSILETWDREKIPYKLEIIGAGALEDDLKEKYLMPNVVFLGKKNHDETLQYISNAKYLLQPSIWYETFGLTIIEAMSLGTPVIGFDIGTRNEMVIDGFNGFLTEESGLYSTIVRAMATPNYDVMRENSIQFSKQFAKDIVTTNQVAIYHELAFGR